MNNNQLNSGLNNILVVDDIADNLRVLSASLTEKGYRVRCAKNGTMALITAKKNPPQLILLDIKMPDMDGYQVCEKLKEDELTRDIPIIFLSAFDDVLDKVKAFSVGGVDYITKPFQAEEVIVRIQHQLALQAAKAEIAELNTQLEQKVQQRTAQLEEVIDQLNLEIAQHQQTQEQLSHQALHDALTGLPNRTLFMEHLTKAIQRHQRNQDFLFAVLFIDLDRFKIINDSWGHAVGDQLLMAISRLLQDCCRELELSIDDFGTGYSSLSYLHRFPVDTLKIDRSFVSLINVEGSNCEIVKTIITLAHSLGMKAIAEGVETPHQITHLSNLGCEAAQGYFFAKPLNRPLAESLIVNNPQW